MTSGVVREWHDDEGWGVLESTETPGGCWDGFDHRAVEVTVEGVPAFNRQPDRSGSAFRSELTIDRRTIPPSEIDR
jgi:hypothetical protein